MTWNQHLEKAADLDDGDPQKWQLLEQFAQAVGAGMLNGAQCVQNHTDGELELRGRFHEYPARLKITTSFLSPEWELKGLNPAGTTLFFHWDPDAVPDVGQFQGQQASDWDDDDDSKKVFFAKGYYLDADGSAMDRQLAIYQALPGEVRQALSTYMVSDRIARFYWYDYASQLLGYTDELNEMAEPLGQVQRGLWLMGQVAWALSQVNVASLPPPVGSAVPGVLYKMTCFYCGSMYLWSQSQRCPNCGAPPRGQ